MPDERSAAATGVPAPATGPAPIVALSDAECREVLAGQRLCTLSLVDGNEPYAVPVYYGFDGEDLYLGVAEGRKTRVLDANPRVYVVVAEVGPGDAWRSVGVAGVARALTEPAERQRAIDVLVAHNRRVRVSDPVSAAAPPAPRRPTGGRLLRIEQGIITGRTRA